MDNSQKVIKAALKDDTAPGGGHNSDGITSDPTIAGVLVSQKNVDDRKARFHGSQSFVDITATVRTDEEFLLDRAELERIWEGRLEDGPYALRLEDEDQNGKTLDATDIAFTLAH